ncbi:hypothetical protein GGF31_006235 [Allomyces arbusculus]|nr:hypothetical protein GGF31_006235 [Allomyces arbusculus]
MTSANKLSKIADNSVLPDVTLLAPSTGAATAWSLSAWIARLSAPFTPARVTFRYGELALPASTPAQVVSALKPALVVVPAPATVSETPTLVTSWPAATILAVRSVPHVDAFTNALCAVPPRSFPVDQLVAQLAGAGLANLSLTTTADLEKAAAESPRFAVLAVRYPSFPRSVVDHSEPSFEWWTFLADSPADASRCIVQLQAWVGIDAEQQRKLALVVNPFAGRKRAGHVAETIVLPMLAAVQVQVDTWYTESRDHATKLAASLPLDQYHGSLVVGGDGIVHEWINGLVSRTDPAAHLVGHVAAGSGNGIAASLNAMHPATTVLAAVRGTSRPLDAVRMSVNGTVLRHCVLSMTWGLIADINWGAETLRWMGPIRFELMALWCFLRVRTYSARITYRPLDSDEWRELDSGRSWWYWTAMNVPHQKASFNAAPHARTNNGAVAIVAKTTPVGMATMFPVLFDQSAGKQVLVNGFQCLSARSVRIEWGDGARGTFVADGERVAEIEESVEPPVVELEVVAGMVRVFAPLDVDEEQFERHVKGRVKKSV